MKTKILLAIIAAVFFYSFNTTTQPEFLFLNQNQLKSLGIELNKDGVFYKNINPNSKVDHERFAGLGFYCAKGNYLSSFHFNESEILKPNNKYEKIMIEKESTHNDFYPLLIGSIRGDMSLDNENLPDDMKFLPVAICLAETKVKDRNDTIVVWFKPTEALQKALPANIRMEDFLKVRSSRQ